MLSRPPLRTVTVSFFGEECLFCTNPAFDIVFPHNGNIMTPTQPCGPTEACRNKGGAAYAGQGDGANQVEQAAETAGNGGEGERGCNRPDALCGYGHPFSSGGGAGRCVGVWGLRSLWSGAGWGGGLRRVRCGGAGGGLLRLYGAAGLCGRAAVCRRSHLDLCGGLRLL